MTLLFIGGSGRSGSTLLDRMLGQVEGCFSVGEFMNLLYTVARDRPCGCGQPFSSCPVWSEIGAVAFGGWDRIDADELIALKRRVDRSTSIALTLAPRLSPGYAADLQRFTDLLATLYDAVREVTGARVIVDSTKHASFAFVLRRVHGLDLRVAHLVRDPRGVAHAWTKRSRRPGPDGEERYLPVRPPLVSTLRWINHNLQFHALRALGVPSLLVRYETLVDRPTEQLRGILAFAGRPAAPGDLDFVHAGAVELDAGHGLSGNPMRAQTGLLELRLDAAWRAEMEPTQQRLVGALTWPLRARYGYLERPARRRAGLAA